MRSFLVLLAGCVVVDTFNLRVVMHYGGNPILADGLFQEHRADSCTRPQKEGIQTDKEESSEELVVVVEVLTCSTAAKNPAASSGVTMTSVPVASLTITRVLMHVA